MKTSHKLPTVAASHLQPLLCLLSTPPRASSSPVAVAHQHIRKEGKEEEEDQRQARTRQTRSRSAGKRFCMDVSS
eukprot:763492-Hanusia_phi.AAC.1